MAETGFSDRLTAYKIVGHFFGLSHLKIMRAKLVFLESVTFQSHARMLSSEVAQSLKSDGHFSDLGVGIALSHRHAGFFGYSKYINPRPRRGLQSTGEAFSRPLGVCPVGHYQPTDYSRCRQWIISG